MSLEDSRAELFEVYESMAPIFSELHNEERAELAAQTDRIDIGEHFHLDSEFDLGDISDAQIDSIDQDRLLVFQPGKRISVIDLEKGTTENLNLDSVLPRDEIRDLKLSSDGQFAAVGRDEKKVIKGSLHRRESTQEVRIKEAHSFGFLPDGRFMHLGKNGMVMIDGEPSDHSLIKGRRLLPDVTERYDRIRVKGGLVDLQTVVRDEAFRDSMETMILLPNGKLKWNKTGWNDHRYVISHRVVHADRADLPSLFEGKEAGLKPSVAYSRDGRGTSMPTASLQTNGHVVEVHDTGYTGGDEFYSHPMYNVVDFLHTNPETNETELLVSQKIDKYDLTEPAFAVSIDGELGFVGKRDGSVEVLDIAKRPKSGHETPAVTADSWVTEEAVASKGLSTFLQWDIIMQATGLIYDDGYGHRKPPKKIHEFKAFEENAVKKIFTTSDGKLCTLGADGRLKIWNIVERAA